MFIPEFVCGILFTIGAEIVLVILYAFTRRNNKGARK